MRASKPITVTLGPLQGRLRAMACKLARNNDPLRGGFRVQ
jgi:hypothetical protein